MAAVALSAHFLVPVHSRITKSGQEPQCGPILTQCGPERPDILSQSGPGKPMFLGPAIYVLRPLQLVRPLQLDEKSPRSPLSVVCASDAVA